MNKQTWSTPEVEMILNANIANDGGDGIDGHVTAPSYDSLEGSVGGQNLPK